MGFTTGDFEYTVKTVNYTEQVPYTVHPLYVDIQTPLADVLPTSTNQLSVLVTDYEGYPVENAQVRAWGKSFIVDDTNAITNKDGVAVISVTAGAAINLEAEVKAQVAFEPPAVMVLPIRLEPIKTVSKGVQTISSLSVIKQRLATYSMFATMILGLIFRMKFLHR